MVGSFFCFFFFCIVARSQFVMVSIISELYCIQLQKKRFYALISNKQANIDILCALKLFDYDHKGNIYNIVSHPGGSQLSKLLIIWYKQMIYMVKNYGLSGYSSQNHQVLFVKAWHSFTQRNSILTVTSPFGWIMYIQHLENVEYFNQRNQVSIYVKEVLDLYIPKEISGTIIDYMFGINLNVCLPHCSYWKLNDSELVNKINGLTNFIYKAKGIWNAIDQIYE